MSLSTAVSSAPCRRVSLGDLTPVVDRLSDGTLRLRAREPLGDYPVRLTDRLEHWAGEASDRTFFAWRSGGTWARLTYAATLEAVRRLGQTLIDRGLSSERPVAVLSGNGAEHLLLALAAQHVGVPYVPVSPSYSLLSSDFATLKRALALVTPGLVFVDDPSRFAGALASAVDLETEIVSVRPWRGGRATTPFEALASADATGAVERAHAAVDADTVAKILFTSGSTGMPKAVINTQRMLTSNQQMILQAFRFLGDEPPVLVDWLPWHHTFGGNHNIGLTIYNGGSLYLDEGRPMPGAFAESARNLKDVPPTVYMNVPRGFDELVAAFRADRDLAVSFFSRVGCLFYAAAGLSQRVAEELQTIAVDTCGERLLLMTGLGATETAPMAICRPWDDPAAAAIGLPVPGLEVKLVPRGERYEVRVKGPNVTPGFWRQEDQTRAAFDDEGFYKMGDAVRLADPAEPARGLVFDGRLAEDFKMSSGTWVHVGPLRTRVVAHFSPLVRDTVITGHDRHELGVLLVPDLDACRALCPGLPDDAGATAILGRAEVRAAIADRLTTLAAAATGSATRITRALLLEEPLSLDAREITDKGALNQRAILMRRADLVDALYTVPPPPSVIAASRGTWGPGGAR